MSIKKIAVVPYNPEWPSLFEKEATRIKKALGDNCIAIHHIGSTSVPGLAAKPIIDCIVEVKDMHNIIEALQALEYRCRGEYNIPFRLFFSTPNFNLHIYEKGHPEIELNLTFRDYLRTHPEARDAYAQLKTSLLTHPDALQKNAMGFAYYTLRKGDFIRECLCQAGLQSLRVLQCLHENEWSAIKNFRKKYFFDPQRITDPYTWTFTEDNHKHLILYKGVDIIGYMHIQLWFDQRAAIRIIIIDENERNKHYGSYFLQITEQWLNRLKYKSLHVEAHPKALEFYRKNGYEDMPFNDPDGYESDPQDKAVGKIF